MKPNFPHLVIFAIFAVILPRFAIAQEHGAQNLYFLPKGASKPDFGQRDYLPGPKKAFYLYRNCVYIFVLNNGRVLHAKLENIKKDSIYYTYFWDGEFEIKDTFSFHPAELREIVVPWGRPGEGLYTHFLTKKRRFVFERTENPKTMQTATRTRCLNDCEMKTYTLAQRVTTEGIDSVYMHALLDTMPLNQSRETTIKNRRNRHRDGIWFTPSTASSISGVNISIQTVPSFTDSLNIRGLNLAADPLSYFVGISLLASISQNNSLVDLGDDSPVKGKSNGAARRQDRINGVSLSLGGIIGDFNIRGFSMNGIVCTAKSAHGVILTGSQNIIREFHGVTFSFLRNISARGKGVQVGMLNVCKNMKGIQVGLWNVNSKRRLPFINWG